MFLKLFWSFLTFARVTIKKSAEDWYASYNHSKQVHKKLSTSKAWAKRRWWELQLKSIIATLGQTKARIVDDSQEKIEQVQIRVWTGLNNFHPHLAQAKQILY